jgi:DNA polymerase III delta subunit
VIFLFHGTDLSTTRELVLKVFEGIQDRTDQEVFKREITYKDVAPEELVELCNSNDIFSAAPMIVFNIAGMNAASLKKYYEKFNKIQKDANLVMISDKELPKSNVLIKDPDGHKIKTRINNRKIQKNVFSFVDAVYNRNRNLAYAELEKTIDDEDDPRSLIPTLTYGLRNIAYAKFEAPQLQKLKPFVRSKAERQAKNFSKDRVIELYQYIYRMDRDSKIGKVPVDIMLPLIIEKVLR